LTDNGGEFSYLYSLGYNLLPEDKKPKDGTVHGFDKVCQDNKIEHRIYAPEGTTLVKHPWTNGMAWAMNKKIKANTVKHFHYLCPVGTTPWTH
jgi:hypothetical protein